MSEFFAAKTAKDDAAGLDYLAPETVSAVMYLLYRRQAELIGSLDCFLLHIHTPNYLPAFNSAG